MTNAGRPRRRGAVQRIRDRAQALFEAEREPHEGLPGNSNALDREHLFVFNGSELVCIDDDRMDDYYERAINELGSEGALAMTDLGPDED